MHCSQRLSLIARGLEELDDLWLSSLLIIWSFFLSDQVPLMCALMCSPHWSLGLYYLYSVYHIGIVFPITSPKVRAFCGFLLRQDGNHQTSLIYKYSWQSGTKYPETRLQPISTKQPYQALHFLSWQGSTHTGSFSL